MSRDPKTRDGLWSHRSKVIALAIAVVIFVGATLAALWISIAAERRALTHQTLRATQQINEKVTFAIGTLHSMGAAHQASYTGFEPTQFEMFADNLVTNQKTITAAGRFEVFPHEDLEMFKSELQLHGLLQFETKGFDQQGALTATDHKPQYSTLIAFFPQDPVSAKFIGLDFSEIKATDTAIIQSVASNAPIPAQLPIQWFSGGQLNVFASTYYGHYVPDTVQDRALQTDGGYFITLDLEQAINEAIEENFPLDIGISLPSVDKKNLIANRNAEATNERLATKIFSSQPVRHNLSVGAEFATIVYRMPSGVTQSQLVSASFKGLGALFFFAIAGAIFAANQASKVKILENEKAMARERERALVTLNSLQDGVITTDSLDVIDYLNPAMLQLLDTDREALIGLPLQQVLDSHFTDHQDDSKGYDAHRSDPNIASIGSIKKLHNDNTESVVFDCHTSAIVNSKSDKIGAVITMRDISKEHALTTELAHQATHDALTGLPNRRKFETLLGSILKGENTSCYGCQVVGYIDLDQFKLVNDTVGHAAGDQLLKKLAVDLETLTPDHIEIARLGGDEFGFISTERVENSPEQVARLFYDFFQSYFYQTDENLFSIRASIGLTTIKPYHVTINDVLSEVDIACYTAKDAGRNGYVVYDAEDLETRKREGEMLYLPILQTALKENRFVLYTQPIVSTDHDGTQLAHHYECLLRLIDEDGEIITPYKFIVAAERYDLIRDIDRWVLDNAFTQIAQFKSTPLEDTIFSINLSGQSAVDPSMPDFIDAKLVEHDIKSSNICFELTETAVISNFSQAQKLIAFARNRGCTIALDDFGAGASSFGYLKNLEVDYLKIDGQFVKEMTSNKVDFEMVRSMNAVGEALGIQTIAEFVENKEIMHALNSINVDFAQGYYIGKPSPMSDLMDSGNKRVAA